MTYRNQIFLAAIMALLGPIFLTACKTQEEKSMTAQEIIDASIARHGGDAYNSLELAYDFRDKSYRIKKEGDYFRYERSFAKDGQQIVDVLENGDFERKVNGVAVELPDTMANKYANSVNSVSYFVLLPKPLNDGAVNKELLGKTLVKGQEYHKIKVTFEQEGGGDDFDDTYVYWIKTDDYSLDYLAYDYHTDGGGIRFRSAFNPRKINGIIVQDYVNYKADPATHTVFQTDSLFDADALEKLSMIETIPAVQ